MIKGDHFEVHVVSNVTEHLAAAVKMCFIDADVATHYKFVSSEKDSVEKNALALAKPLSQTSAIDGGWVKLPYELNAIQATNFLQGWLGTVKPNPKQRPNDEDTVVEGAWEIRSLYGNDQILMIWPTYSVYSK